MTIRGPKRDAHGIASRDFPVSMEGPSFAEVQERYPRMRSAMQRQGNLSKGEAEVAIVSLANRVPNYGEAVMHYGGIERLARDAFRNRNLGRR